MSASNSGRNPDLPDQLISLIGGLVKSWETWKWVFGTIATALVLGGVWAINNLYILNTKLAEFTRVPDQVTKMDDRLRSIEVKLGKAEELPSQVKSLQDNLSRLGSVPDALQAHDVKLKEATQASETLLRRVDEVATAADVSKRAIDKTAKEVESIAKQLSTWAGDLEKLRLAAFAANQSQKHFAYRFPLPQKAADEAKIDGFVRLTFRVPIPAELAPSPTKLEVQQARLETVNDDANAFPVITSAEIGRPNELTVHLYVSDPAQLSQVTARKTLYVVAHLTSRPN